VDPRTTHVRGQSDYLRGWLALSLQPRDNDNGLDPYSISGSVALRGARVKGGGFPPQAASTAFQISGAVLFATPNLAKRELPLPNAM
jgi:hypothetical protein